MSPLRNHHRFDTALGPHLLLADASRIYALGPDTARAFDNATASGEQQAAAVLTAAGLNAQPRMGATSLSANPPLRSISLAVAQSCNLGCTYCYAQEGSFGKAPAAMPASVARAAIDRLIAHANPGERVQIAYLGGEPLANRALVREATEYAVALARAQGVRVAFAMTTNGTLVRPDDGDFFARHKFAVTVSLDGTQAQHDAQRPFANGAGSYRRIIDRLRPLLARADLDIAARVTVTPANLDLAAALQDLGRLGFRSVGFSPMLSSPTGAGQLQAGDLRTLLDQMIACGELLLRSVMAGDPLPFENMQSALREIHRGTHRPYPCGAGAGYFGVAADGTFSACHRFVGDEAGAMGSVAHGIDQAAQTRWLAERAVDRQEPCRSCWARYLCGGGCHHEVIHRGRPACDYIRGWLDFCLRAYVVLLDARPAYFETLT
jgi:uncharacterized protein